MLTFGEENYPNVGSKEIAGKVIDSLRSHDIEIEAVERGIDHGVWASFEVAFDPEKNSLNVPIVQVSLFSSEDPDQHYNLGRSGGQPSLATHCHHRLWYGRAQSPRSSIRNMPADSVHEQLR